jgi:hypothetical protein
VQGAHDALRLLGRESKLVGFYGTDESSAAEVLYCSVAYFIHSILIQAVKLSNFLIANSGSLICRVCRILSIKCFYAS